MPYDHDDQDYDHHDQKSFRIKHEDDKFFTKLLSKESSKSNPSFRVYYGDVHVAVPFTWETCPGTPKHSSSHNSHIPPLTPPPSYFTNLNPDEIIESKKSSRSKILLHTLLRRMVNPKKSGHVASSSSLSSLSWSSSSRSHDHHLMTPTYKRRRFSSWGSSFDDSPPAHVDEGFSRPTKEKLHGRYSVFIVKKALLSIVGCGSA